MLIRWKSKDKSSSNSSSSSSKKKRKGREGGKQSHAISMGRSSFQLLFRNKFYASEWNFQFFHSLFEYNSKRWVCVVRRDQAITSHQKPNRINSITEKIMGKSFTKISADTSLMNSHLSLFSHLDLTNRRRHTNAQQPVKHSMSERCNGCSAVATRLWKELNRQQN